MEFKKCVKCEITKPKENFDKARAKCKQCRACKNKEYYKNTRIAEREIKRKEFFTILEERCKIAGIKFNHRHLFLEEETLALMQLQKDLYDFCEVPEQIAKKIRETDDYIEGYILKHIYINDNISKKMFTRIII